MATRLTLTVSQLNEYVRRMFQLDPMLHRIELKGEISNLKFHQTGAVFFTMKDEQATISCVMYAQDAQRLTVVPFEGMRAVAVGSVGLYARGGQYQMTVTQLGADGVGVLYERLQALKGRLAREGLFDERRKKPLPGFVDTVGVVSSPTGAVIHDILNVSLRRDPTARILLCPVRVQGIGAADEVAQAIGLLDRLANVSVIVVARGGGSMEDLFAFNEEAVVRAVAACGKPVVSAVGHETDVTLCDLAADLRVPTPSAAAECAIPMRAQVLENVMSLRYALSDAACRRIEAGKGRLALLAARLAACHPAQRIKAEQMRLSQIEEALHRTMEGKLSACRLALSQKETALSLLSPYAVLSRGYAIVTRQGAAVDAAGRLAPGDSITLRFADGCAQAVVTQGANREEEEA